MSGSSSNFIYIFIGVVAIMFAFVVFAYLRLRRKSQNEDVVRIENLRKGTEQKSFSWDVFYQKLYLQYLKIPILRTYLLKVRRRLEINNIDDEFVTRLQSAKIITKALGIIIPLTILIIFLTRTNFLLMFIILIFELFMIDSFTDAMVNKLDDDLLLQQVDFFAQIRHSYHEVNMVAEAIYQTAQDSEHVEISRQAEEIYNILNSSDPETALEKYYDVAPNNYLKEFAGISYLTQEFGDRKIDGNSSLYLKNLENISQEMQLEILKRDKLNYVFQSLSIIAITPTVMLEPLKKWAVSNFAFTKAFYNGNKGLLVQVIIMIATVVCYGLIRKLKDNGSTKIVQNVQNPWQEKVYKKVKIIRDLVVLLMPAKDTKDRRKLERSLKEAGSHQKIRWLYINKILLCAVVFVVSIVFFSVLHKVEIHYIFTEPTTTYNLIGDMGEKEEERAKQMTERQNVILRELRGKNVTLEEIQKTMKKNKVYNGFSDSDIKTESQKIQEKLNTINKEYLKWFEVLIAIMFAMIGYYIPNMLLFFSKKMRTMEMEDEVMSYQTIIMMLMRIERVDVEMILEWLERYADIFKDQIGKCLNNYESGAWEALEEMKEEVTYEPFIRIIESLQTSVEKVPIKEAFEELDSDRDYYKDKRKETNERLISKKSRLGRLFGFAPMVIAFIGYLIVPLIVIGLTSMMSTFNAMSSMQ